MIEIGLTEARSLPSLYSRKNDSIRVFAVRPRSALEPDLIKPRLH